MIIAINLLKYGLQVLAGSPSMEYYLGGLFFFLIIFQMTVPKYIFRLKVIVVNIKISSHGLWVKKALFQLERHTFFWENINLLEKLSTF